MRSTLTLLTAMISLCIAMIAEKREGAASIDLQHIYALRLAKQLGLFQAAIQRITRNGHKMWPDLWKHYLRTNGRFRN